VPNFTSNCSTLLHVLGKLTTNIPTFVDESYTLVSQHDDNKSGKGCQKCKHYYNLGHKIDRYYTLHGHPP